MKDANYGRVFKNHPVDEQDFYVDSNMANYVKHQLLGKQTAETEPAILQEIKKLSPAELALRLEIDPEFKKRCAQYRP